MYSIVYDAVISYSTQGTNALAIGNDNNAYLIYIEGTNVVMLASLSLYLLTYQFRPGAKSHYYMTTIIYLFLSISHCALCSICMQYTDPQHTERDRE